MAQIATLLLVAKSTLWSLASETHSSHKAQKLKEPVTSICRSLLSAQKKLDTGANQSETLKSWVKEVGKAVYEASDLVDEVAAGSLALKVHSLSKSCLAKVGTSSGFFSMRMGSKINRLCNELTRLHDQAAPDDTSQSYNPFAGEEKVENEPLTIAPRPYVGDIMVDPLLNSDNLNQDSSPIVGIGIHVKPVVDYLLNTNNLNQDTSLIAISGVEGIGKTTLARLVYANKKIKNFFDLQLWVPESCQFDLRQILIFILQNCSAGSSNISDFELNKLKDLSRGAICGKLFFLVLNDVQNESDEEWHKVMSVLLTLGARGSKILVTTRSQDAVKAMRPDKDVKLPGLTEVHSLQLFKVHAFDMISKPVPKNLYNIAQKICDRCHGVPILLIAIARFLYEQSVDHWQETLHQLNKLHKLSDIWDCVLRLSYNHLLSQLKACLAYCSLHPVGYKFKIIDLVSLWMAQGFLEPKDSQDLEDVAEEYFLMLYNRGFFLHKPLDEYGSLKSCMMHGFVHDFARNEAREWATSIHLPSFHRSDSQLLQKNLVDGHKLRTFLFDVKSQDDYRLSGLIGKNNIVEMSYFKSLRVLDMHAFGIQTLPDSIGDLIHLRYLDLSSNKSLLKLPNSITNLYHLQTLKLNFCYELEELPTSFGKLVYLRRIEIDGCEKLIFMPPGFENLSSLRTLSRYVVGRPHLQSASGFEALGNLNHLRGRMMIELSVNWTMAAKEAVRSNLSNKSRLTELEIKWGPTPTSNTVEEQYKKLLLDGLQPPSSLKMLQIEGYRGQDFPSWASGDTLLIALPNLITVSIDGCGKCKTLPPFCRLPWLRSLSLLFMEEVKFFESSDNRPSSYFPSLKELTLHSFYNLEGWWEEETQVQSVSFSRLQKLKIWSCPKLKSMPLFPFVKVLHVQNINEKLLEFHSASMTRSKLQTSKLPSSSHSQFSNIEPREHSWNLPSLVTVHIKSCLRLKTLAFVKASKNLKKLVIERSDMLSSLTEVLKQLTLLEELEIAGCKDLDLSVRCQDSCNGCEECYVPWKYLTNLHCLSLRELPKLATLPIGLKCVKTLKTLCISTCNCLSTLLQCISNLNSLQHLKLEGCPALEMLPEGLKDIKSLVKIDIIECPQLMERCREGGGDWDKIKHARVLCHKSWRYALMSETELSQKPKEKGKTIFVHSENPTIHSFGLQASCSTNEVALNLSVKTRKMKISHSDF